MKSTLIAIGLLATASLALPAFARGGVHLLDPAWNPQHISGLPAEVRNALTHMCRDSKAEHPRHAPMQRVPRAMAVVTKDCLLKRADLFITSTPLRDRCADRVANRRGVAISSSCLAIGERHNLPPSPVEESRR
jgi:hypothetical protein